MKPPSFSEDTADDFKRLNPHIFPPGTVGRSILESEVKKDQHPLSREDLKLEKELQNQIAGHIERDGVVVIRSRTDRKTTTNVGLPDLLFVLKGTPVGFEVKRPGKKPTLDQLRMHERMRRDGWWIFIVDNYDEAIERYRKCVLKIYC